MSELWLPLKDLPAEGREFSFADPDFWERAWKLFRVPCSMGAEPLSAVLTVIPQDGGVLLRGSIQGTITMICDRCTCETQLNIDVVFDEFEPTPTSEWDAQDDDTGEAEKDEPRIREERGQMELDAGTVIWEQFVLALPHKPLCSETCRGLCPSCGTDLNKDSCDCAEPGLDPRLAPLRNLKIS